MGRPGAALGVDGPDVVGPVPKLANHRLLSRCWRWRPDRCHSRRWGTSRRPVERQRPVGEVDLPICFGVPRRPRRLQVLTGIREPEVAVGATARPSGSELGFWMMPGRWSCLNSVIVPVAVRSGVRAVRGAQASGRREDQNGSRGQAWR